MIPTTDVLAMAREAGIGIGAKTLDKFEDFASKCAAYDNAELSAKADKVMISNATGNHALFMDAVQELIAAIRGRNTP